MSGVDTYDCPEPGCDFNVSAVGPQDPDEPDYFAEDIEQHKRGHECRCTFHLGMVHVDPECPLDGQAANTPSDGATPLWTDSYGDEHEVYPVGTEIVYNGIPDVVGDLDGESAVITGHDLADEVTPYEIRFTRVERMASPDHFWVPAPTADLADADRPALADALAPAAHHLEVADPTCDCPLHVAIAALALATDRALREVTLPPADERSIVDAVARGTSSQAGLQAVMHTPTSTPGGAVTDHAPAPSGAPSLVELDRHEAVVEAIRVALYRTPYAELGWKPEPGRFETDDAASEHLARLIAPAVSR